MSDMRVDRSLQKKMEKNNKSARTHPAYRQSWDTLIGEEFFARKQAFYGREQNLILFYRWCYYATQKYHYDDNN